jgi:hypothetical protein
MGQGIPVLSDLDLNGNVLLKVKLDSTNAPDAAGKFGYNSGTNRPRYHNGSASKDLVESGGVVNADIASSAAIAYSKLNLANSILNSDIDPAAAIAQSKLADLGKEGAADLLTNIRRRFSEGVSANFIYHGLVVSAGAGLNVNVTAGVSYVNGARVSTGAQTNILSLTASTSNQKIYVDNAGSFGTTTGTLTANQIWLASVDTGASTVTAATDKRIFAPWGQDDHFQSWTVTGHTITTSTTNIVLAAGTSFVKGRRYQTTDSTTIANTLGSQTGAKVVLSLSSSGVTVSLQASSYTAGADEMVIGTFDSASNNTTSNAADSRTLTPLKAMSGANLTSLNASNLTSGTVPLARLSGITTAELSASANIADTQLASGTTQTGQSSKIAKFASDGTLRLGADPSNALDAATKQYVDTASSATTVWKQPVKAATTAALAAYTYAANVLTASANGAFPSQDGVSIALNDRVLVKNESGANEKYNGVFTLTQVGDGSTPWKLTRATDADADAEVKDGMIVPISQGTRHLDTAWKLKTNDTITLNTTALTFIPCPGRLVAFTITGDGATTTFDLAHGFNTRDIMVQVRESQGAYKVVAPTIEDPASSPLDQVRITFATAPANGTNYRAMVAA